MASIAVLNGSSRGAMRRGVFRGGGKRAPGYIKMGFPDPRKMIR
jgi:hypothetical protein